MKRGTRQAYRSLRPLCDPTYDCPQQFTIGRGHISGYEARAHVDKRPHRHRNGFGTATTGMT
ncbi:hypothetical protein FOV72_14235 [Gordonia rubripertincta]|nr:hypothetical protein FOV72_14235 [Gordonia rubripertincta]